MLCFGTPVAEPVVIASTDKARVLVNVTVEVYPIIRFVAKRYDSFDVQVGERTNQTATSHTVKRPLCPDPFVNKFVRDRLRTD